MKGDSISENDTNGLTPTNSEPNGLNGRKSRMNGCSKLSLTALALVLVGITGSSLRGDDDKNSDKRWKQLVIDVANDARTVALIQVNPADTLPKRGAKFIVNGKMYPGGTIPVGDGLDIDALTGSIGISVTRATFNFDASQQSTPGADPLLSSNQDYLFSSTAALNGEDSLMSEGQESIVASTHRVVLGGTGIYRGTIGEVKQELLGRNSTGFLNFRFTFLIRTPE
jgi:hypothetical protein